jgi:acetyl esterase/lipase
MLIQVGTAEVLLDDSTRLATLAENSGVDVKLEIWEDMFHVWHGWAVMLPEAREAIKKIGKFIQSRIP